jgi:Fe2+/Zn2+ uptake regulation proteins
MRKPSDEKLSNHEIVFTALNGSRKPMTAYDLLGRLGPKGIAAPTTVYRALDRLIADGRVHRLESLNAFMACGCKHSHNLAAFSICDGCGAAEEIPDPRLQSAVTAVAGRAGFSARHTTIEMHGLCQRCSGA